MIQIISLVSLMTLAKAAQTTQYVHCEVRNQKAPIKVRLKINDEQADLAYYPEGIVSREYRKTAVLKLNHREDEKSYKYARFSGMVEEEANVEAVFALPKRALDSQHAKQFPGFFKLAEAESAGSAEIASVRLLCSMD